MADVRELEDTKERFPTHEEIEKLAYELYRQAGEEGTAIEYRLIAKAELRQGHAKGASASLKKKAATGFQAVPTNPALLFHTRLGG